MTTTQLVALSVPWALLLMLTLMNLARVMAIWHVRMWFLGNDYPAYRRLPSYDEMVGKHWRLWTLASWQAFLKGNDAHPPV